MKKFICIAIVSLCLSTLAATAQAQGRLTIRDQWGFPVGSIDQPRTQNDVVIVAPYPRRTPSEAFMDGWEQGGRIAEQTRRDFHEIQKRREMRRQRRER